MRAQSVSNIGVEVIFAYIDPGAGSMLIQAVIAGILAVPFVLRTQIRSVLDPFRRHGDQ